MMFRSQLLEARTGEVERRKKNVAPEESAGREEMKRNLLKEGL